jgi:hypothetical protein
MTSYEKQNNSLFLHLLSSLTSRSRYRFVDEYPGRSSNGIGHITLSGSVAEYGKRVSYVITPGAGF